MKKSTYFFITCLLLGGYWNNTYTALLNLNDVLLVIGWIWCILGFVFFRKERHNNPLLTYKNIKLLLYIFGGVLISSFLASIYHNESLLSIFIAQRQIYNWMYFILFLYMQPSLIDIEKSLKKLSIIAVLLFAISIKYPLLFTSSTDLDFRLFSGSTDIGANTPGMIFVILYIYFLISKMDKNFSIKLFLKISFYVLIVILYQNRSALIGVSIAYLIGIFRIKSRYKYIYYILVFAISGILVIQFIEIFQSLYEETFNQLNDPDYNRWQALHFFLFDYNTIPLCQIFGNGTPVLGSQYLADLINAQITRYAYVSDIGLLGMYFYYGVIPLLVVYSVIFKTLLKYRYPMFLKFQCLHILIVPTIFEFAWGGAFTFSIIFYLFCYFSMYNKSSKTVIHNNKYKCLKN